MDPDDAAGGQPEPQPPGPDLAAVTWARASQLARQLRTRNEQRQRSSPSSTERGGDGERQGLRTQDDRSGGYSGAHPDRRDPASLGRALDGLVNSRGWTHELAVAGVLSRWTEIVGADVAAHVVPDTVTPPAADPGQSAGTANRAARPTRGATLVLQADSTAWATQMRLLLPTVQGRLDAELGAGVIGRVVVNGPAAPSWRKGAWHVKGRGPRDTYG